MAEITLNTDDLQIIGDRMENVGAVVCFLGEASRAMCERDEPVTPSGIFGMYLTFNWVEETLQVIEGFIRKEKPIAP